MLRGDEYRLRESDDVLSRLRAILGDLDRRCSATEELADAFRTGNRGDIDILIARYNETIGTTAEQISQVLTFLQNGDLTANVVVETPERRFLTDTREAAIKAAVVGGASAGRDTLAKLSAALDTLQAAQAAILSGASTALDTFAEVSTAIAALDAATSAALANRVRFDAAQALTAEQRAQAKANLAIAGADIVSARTAVSASYTVQAADRGRVIVCSTGASFTLSTVAAATAGAGFYFYIQKTDGAGVVTLDPNGAETIAGLASIKVYQESFLVWTDGTNWHTQGRQRGWIPLGSVSLTGQTLSVISITTGFGDPELSEISARIDNLVKSASSQYSFGVVKSGSPITTSTYNKRGATVSTSVAATGGTASAAPQNAANTVGPEVVDLTLRNANSASLTDQIVDYTAYNASAMSGTAFGQFGETTAGSVGGFYLSPGTGTFSSVAYKLKGFRQ